MVYDTCVCVCVWVGGVEPGHNDILLGILTCEDGTDTLSRNVGK
jgi:hypothetical protein